MYNGTEPSHASKNIGKAYVNQTVTTIHLVYTRICSISRMSHIDLAGGEETSSCEFSVVEAVTARGIERLKLQQVRQA